ncbi:DNA-binding protein D-ETS-4-like [Crassostrea angulata]|uniref:DNA-binding protein D-ETS-4-like n=1 Tax=Magallana angulata TaxID=2784310 RepID=UPI0022B0FF57|nr:DNA-binding protein D-ETS-4-like [Crassostrea angulata]
MSSVAIAASSPDPRFVQSILMEDTHLPGGGANCHVTYSTVKTEIMSSEERPLSYENSSPCYTLLQPMQQNPSPVLFSGPSEVQVQRRFDRSPPPLIFDDPRSYQNSTRIFEEPGLKVDTHFGDISPTLPPQHSGFPPQTQPVQQSENFEESVLKALQEEIDHICHILEICPDPTKWTNQEVNKWIVWYGDQFGAPQGITDRFRMSGEELCRLTLEDFKQKSKDAGPNFHAQLDVWKNACKLSARREQHSGPPPSNYYYNSYRHNSVSSPTISECSETSGAMMRRDDYIFHQSAGSDYPSPPVMQQPVGFHPEYPSQNEAIPSYSDYYSYTDYNFYDNNSDTPFTQTDDLPGYPVECQQKQTIHLWRFLKELLLQPERYDRYIRWVNRQEGIFKIEDSPKVAKLWGKRKNRPAMNYDKLSRSIRQYYRKGIIKKTANSKRLVYQFCPAYL